MTNSRDTCHSTRNRCWRGSNDEHASGLLDACCIHCLNGKSTTIRCLGTGNVQPIGFPLFTQLREFVAILIGTNVANLIVWTLANIVPVFKPFDDWVGVRLNLAFQHNILAHQCAFIPKRLEFLMQSPINHNISNDLPEWKSAAFAYCPPLHRLAVEKASSKSEHLDFTFQIYSSNKRNYKFRARSYNFIVCVLVKYKTMIGQQKTLVRCGPWNWMRFAARNTEKQALIFFYFLALLCCFICGCPLDICWLANKK